MNPVAQVQVGGKGKNWTQNADPRSGLTLFTPATPPAGAAGPGGEAAFKVLHANSGLVQTERVVAEATPGAQLGQAGQQQDANRAVHGEQEVLSVRAHETKAGWKR